jgi:hypothetical protein
MEASRRCAGRACPQFFDAGAKKAFTRWWFWEVLELWASTAETGSEGAEGGFSMDRFSRDRVL